MGGNVFKDRTVRYSKDEYLVLEDDILHSLKSMGIVCSNIPAYHNKQSFGDMDLLVESESVETKYNWLEYVKALLNVSEVVKNGNIYSLLVNDFQVDLILTPKKYMYSSYIYFGVNDFSNILGRLSHKMGIKFGHKGLSIVVRESQGHILGEIELTTNPAPIFEILGLSFEEYLKGFDELEDIFKFIASSPYFNPEVYALDNRSNTPRTRDKKRKTYSEFLKWCEANKDSLTHYPWNDLSERGGYNLREPWYSEVVLKYWPETKDKVDTLINDYLDSKAAKEIMSSDIVMEVSGLEGKELGHFITFIKEGIYVRLSLTNKDILKKDKEWYKGIVEACLYVWDDNSSLL